MLYALMAKLIRGEIYDELVHIPNYLLEIIDTK
jgi:hypothetical protein